MSNIALKAIGILLFSGVLMLSACKEDLKELGPPASKREGISGSWMLKQVDQVDLTSRPVFDVRVDVSDIIVGDDPMTITFKDEEGSYTVEKGSSKVDFFGSSGTWSFDDDRFPTLVTFGTDMGDLVVLNLSQTVRPRDNQLIFEFEVGCAEDLEPQHGFEYIFDRIQQ